MYIIIISIIVRIYEESEPSIRHLFKSESVQKVVGTWLVVSSQQQRPVIIFNILINPNIQSLKHMYIHF